MRDSGIELNLGLSWRWSTLYLVAVVITFVAKLMCTNRGEVAACAVNILQESLMWKTISLSCSVTSATEFINVMS